MVMRYESIRGELSFPALQDHSQNCFGILETGAEWASRVSPAHGWTDDHRRSPVLPLARCPGRAEGLPRGGRVGTRRPHAGRQSGWGTGRIGNKGGSYPGVSLRCADRWRSRSAPPQGIWPSYHGHDWPDELLRAQYDDRRRVPKGSAELLEVTFSSGPDRCGDRHDGRRFREVSVAHERDPPRALSRRGSPSRYRRNRLSAAIGGLQLPRGVTVDEPGGQRVVHRVGARDLCRDAVVRWP